MVGAAGAVAAVAGAEVLALAVHVGLRKHRFGPIGRAYPLELRGHDLGSLIPTDALVLARTAVLGVAAAGPRRPWGPAYIPVHALE